MNQEMYDVAERLALATDRSTKDVLHSIEQVISVRFSVSDSDIANLYRIFGVPLVKVKGKKRFRMAGRQGYASVKGNGSEASAGQKTWMKAFLPSPVSCGPIRAPWGKLPASSGGSVRRRLHMNGPS